MTSDLDRSVEELVRCPVGGAFLAYVDANTTVADAVTPRVAFALAAEAVAQLDPWRSNHERVRRRALEFGRELRDLARELLSHRTRRGGRRRSVASRCGSATTATRRHVQRRSRVAISACGGRCTRSVHLTGG
jgi:hypothetical protein